MVRSCCAVCCNLKKGLSFHSFPTWKQHEGAHVSDVTKRRRLAWIAAVRRADIQFSSISKYILVCSRHFHSSNGCNFKKEAKISLFLYSTFEQWYSVSTYSVNANYLHGSAIQA
uniref:THAP-type domain-containing protein n=1 Tax=Neolamprologus brichardi TaxID=32507 RepID=A0A3Q4MT77_NEOBR